MAAPNYGGYRWQERDPRIVAPGRPETVPGRDAGRDLRKKRARERGFRKRDARRRRSFVFIVIVPVVLMLGSEYLHTVAADVGRKTTELQEAISGTEAKQEALEVRESELSDSERIRSIASEDLGMTDPDSTDFRSYNGNAEDWNNGVIEQRQGEDR